MAYEANKYYLKFAWLPTRLNNGGRIWFKKYYEAHVYLPIIHQFKAGVYQSCKRISTDDYLVDTLKGNIVNGIEQISWNLSEDK